ncbi:uncharacterized protein LOC111029518 isoform X2 [Myzus persicae]|uniref:uncharacterized protein LOC111029518 isoform X2 n=1 Tax=Myzus persicae TaxID=13164 RepID=UPI000B932823|nr:uncharacterized protein LOC111029518 isoform X2 [Myzus persicae]
MSTMVKHINMLALFIMFYIIGNAMALTPAERKARQFYDHGLLGRNTGVLGPLPYGTEETFDALLERFYRVLFEMNDEENFDTISNDIEDSYASDNDYRMIKKKFFNDIIHVYNFHDKVVQYKFDIGARNRQFPSPFDKFVNNHILVPGRLDYYETASKFCDHYSKGIKLETNWARSFNY